MAKPKTVRRKGGYRAALRRKGVSKIHREYHDFDYLHKLSEEELEWMARFIDSELQSNTCSPGSCPPEEHEEHKRLYRESNARRGDLQGQLRIGRATIRYRRRKGTDLYKSFPVYPEYLDQEATMKDGGEIPNKHDLVGNRRHGLEEDAVIARIDRDKKQPD